MSPAEPTRGSFVEFIDDYFVECEEHLTVARRSLLALEPSVNQEQPDRTLLDELFRSFHSVKGLSAMVGVRAAEQLAHDMESYLSALRKGETRLTLSGLEILIAGVQMLDRVVAARRTQAAAPDVAPLLAQFANLVGQPRAEFPAKTSAPPVTEDRTGAGAEWEVKLDAALKNGGNAWRFTFVPAPALAERGVNVNTVRQRLLEVGELLQAAPSIQEGGQIAFSFIVVSTVEESRFADWRADGLDYAPFVRTPVAAIVVPSEAPAASTRSSAAGSGGHLVRVDLERLDELMRLVGELVISRARLDDSLRRLGPVLPAGELRGLQETNLALERQLRDLREGVMRVRMVQVREVFARMQFVVRDLTREFGKKALLELTGQDTEIDKFVVERMMDPLLHLVRNAVSHALESPAERLTRGKAPEGRIALRARTAGETITIEVEDDGRGIDAAQVFARARATGLGVTGALDDPAALLDVLCASGFSTRDEADRASGRGVGMAVVRTVVEELGGSLTVRTEVGLGTCFTIQLPLTLAIADALVVAVGTERYAVPQVSVREVIQFAAERVTAFENNEVLYYRDGVLPLLRLGKFFRLAEQGSPGVFALVTGEGLNAIGITVDRVLGLREIVVRPLTDPLVRVAGVAGATELGDGRVVLILDAAGLGRVARQHGTRAAEPIRA